MISDDPDWALGDILLLHKDRARHVCNLTFDTVIDHISDAHETNDDVAMRLMNLTMVWKPIANDVNAIVVSRLCDQRTGFSLYFVMADGGFLTLFGDYAGIEFIQHTCDE